MTGWQPRSWDEICRRASARRRYNSVRKLRAEVRRFELAEHVRRHGLAHGEQKALAAQFQVSPSTISKDLAAIRQKARRCPTCGRFSEKVEAYLSR